MFYFLKIMYGISSIWLFWIGLFFVSENTHNTLEDLQTQIKTPHFFNQLKGLSARQHSKDLDKLLGFKIPKIEQKLLKTYRAFHKAAEEGNRKKHYEGTQTWIGLHPQVLQTPYSEIHQFFSYFTKFKVNKVVDLGAGYGRVGLVMNSFFPAAEFIGYEILTERIKEANRVFDHLDITNCDMRSQNILDESFEIPAADIYFIYDFSDPHDLRVILKKLSQKLFKERFFIIAKGEGIRSLIQLRFPEFWVSNGVIHQKEWSLYSSMDELN